MDKYRTITTKYRKECYECGEMCEAGDRVVWDYQTSAVWHEACDRKNRNAIDKAARNAIAEVFGE